MAGEVTPRAAFPLRMAGGSLQTIEQDSERHLEDQAEVILRTRPGTHDMTPDLGLRNLAGTLDPVAPKILSVLEDHVDARFTGVEDETLLSERIRSVSLAIQAEDG